MLEKNFGKDKILLIEPPFYSLFGYKRYHYPLTSVIVGTYLEEKGYKVKILDMDKPRAGCKEYGRTECGHNYPRYEAEIEKLSHPLWNELKELLLDFKPDAVAISVSITAKDISAKAVTEIVRKTLGGGVKIIAGGAHINGMLESYPGYDFDNCYDEIVTHIPDIIDRKPNKKLLIGYESYQPENFHTIMTSLGCPNSCTFCCNSMSEAITYRNIASIEEELLEIKKDYGCFHPIYYVDECFLSNSERMEEITNISRKLGFKFKAGSRIKNLSNDTLRVFKSNGGTRMFVGVESGSQTILDKVKKNITIPEIISRTALLNDIDISWSAFFVTGFPFETADDIELTKELMVKIKPSFISLNRFVPYPGTKIFKEYYLNGNLDFASLFQQNLKRSGVWLSDEMERYLEDLFEFADLYNKENNK